MLHTMWLYLNILQVIIFDEADRLLEMGFKRSVYSWSGVAFIFILNNSLLYHHLTLLYSIYIILIVNIYVIFCDSDIDKIMKFLEASRTISSNANEATKMIRQTLLFSATLSPEIKGYTSYCWIRTSTYYSQQKYKRSSTFWWQFSCLCVEISKKILRENFEYVDTGTMK